MPKGGFEKTTLNNIFQILYDTKNQSSVGCIVPQTMAGADGWVHQGTPINIDLDDINTPVKAVDLTSTPKVGMNAILLHDVYVGTTAGATGNGTACIFGFVNKNRIKDTSVVTAIEAAAADATASKLLTFAKL